MYTVSSIVETAILSAKSIAEEMFKALYSKKATPIKDEIACSFVNALLTLGVDADIVMDYLSKVSALSSKKEMICFVWAVIHDISEDIKRDNGLKTGAEAFQEWIDSVEGETDDENIPF